MSRENRDLTFDELDALWELTQVASHQQLNQLEKTFTVRFRVIRKKLDSMSTTQRNTYLKKVNIPDPQW